MIDCAFSRLKTRCRNLLHPMDIPIEKLPIIYACFELHNFWEEVKGEVDANFVEKLNKKNFLLS